MENISPELKEDYERWRYMIGDDIYIGPKTVGIFDVLRAHYLIIDFFSSEYGEGVGGVGPKDLNLLHSTLSRQNCGYEKMVKWNEDFQICATLFWGLIKNHAFHDANKRTAFLTLLYHLLKIKRFPTAKHKEYERLAIRIAKNELNAYPSFEKFKKVVDGEVLFVADFLRKNTRKIERTEYVITYRQLDAILNKYSYGLENPDKNQITIIRIQEERVGIFSKKTMKLEKRIGAIGFPGWNRQVNIETVKNVRKLCHLTAEDGVDSEAFFHDQDSLPSLIAQFQKPLERLADR